MHFSEKQIFMKAAGLKTLPSGCHGISWAMAHKRGKRRKYT